MENSNELVKYPRTPHLPFSAGVTSDDKIVDPKIYSVLQDNPEFIVTEKMDGGNLTMTNKHFFARSLDSGVSPWDTAVKRIHSEVAYNIPPGYRINGESLFARRSMGYDNLQSFFLVFGVVNEDNVFLSWEETEEWATLLGLTTVPTLYRGSSFKEALSAWKGSGKTPEDSEGFVLRNSGSFAYSEFGRNVVKYVRANHVQTAANWRNRDDFDLNSLA